MAEPKPKTGITIIKKKKKGGGHGAHGGAWKVAYADFVTAMMAFFMVMWLMGSDDETKEAIAAYFNQPMNLGIIDFSTRRAKVHGDKIQNTHVLEGSKGVMEEQGIEPEKQKKSTRTPDSIEEESKMLEESAKQIYGELTEENLDENLDVIIDERGLVIRIGDTVFFRSGSARINPKALPILERVLALKQRINLFLEIAGHTDSAPIQSTQFESNWELSAVRASTVLRYFLYNHVDPKTLRATGYADSQPLMNVKGQPLRDPAANRRVEFVFHKVAPLGTAAGRVKRMVKPKDSSTTEPRIPNPSVPDVTGQPDTEDVPSPDVDTDEVEEHH